MDRIDIALTETIGEYSAFFDDVRVPAENLVSEDDSGLFSVIESLKPDRIALAAQQIGFSKFVLDRAV